VYNGALQQLAIQNLYQRWPWLRRPDGYHLAIFHAPARGFWRLSGFMKLPGFYPSDVPAVGPSLV
jgi:hypothetical protein